MKIQQLTAAEAIASLNSSPDGLSRAEAARRIREFGPNQVKRWRVNLCCCACSRNSSSFFPHSVGRRRFGILRRMECPGQGMARLGYAIIVVILVSGLFSFWQEYRAERTLAALRKLLPQQVNVLRDGKAHRLPADQLVPGDIILLEQGDNIPADCRLIEAFCVRVNNATITGESLPQAREAGPSKEEEIIRGKTSCSPAPRWCQARPRRSSLPPVCIPNSAKSPISPKSAR